MKKLAILGVIFLSLNSFAQDVTAESSDQDKVLYRGFENKLTLGPVNGTSEALEIETINCKVAKLEGSENTYIVKTKSGSRTARINVMSNGEVVETTTFKVQNLPAPSIYWGNQKTGSTVSNLPELEIKYDSGVSLESNFKIVSWACKHKETSFKGSGNLLSQEMLDYTKSMAKGEVVNMLVAIKGEDGIVRKAVGSWVK